MRCSSCSREVFPVVAVDIDGTLGDYHGHFINFAELYLGKLGTVDEFATYDGTGSFRKWCQVMWDIDERTWNDIKLAYRQGGMKRSMPIFDGAAALCQRIREAGAELWLTTTRPYLRLDNIDPDTREWLRRHDIDYDGLLYDEFKYRRLASIVDRERVVAVVDDLPEMIEAAQREFGWRIPILRKTQFNRSVAAVEPQGFETMPHLRNEVISRINSWREDHGSN